VRSDFPITLDDRELTGQPERGTRLGRGGGRGTGRGTGRAGARMLRGVSGSGGPLVTVRTFRGDITIARR